MFDFRYHVVSLAAVFLALILGILVGVAISDPELANRTELIRQREQIGDLEEQLQAADDRSRRRDAAERFLELAYPAVMQDRLAGRRVLLVFVGSVDGAIRGAVDRTLEDAGASLAPLRALSMPLRADAVATRLDGLAALAGYRGEDHLADLGRDLGRELVEGGETPLWDALETTLVEQRRGVAGRADAVVLARTVRPQGGETGSFLRGFYAGLRAGAPVVGVEKGATESSAVPTFRRVGFSSVYPVDTTLGRVTLAVLLDGGAAGHFGLQDDGRLLLPPIAPIEPDPGAGD